MDVETAVSDLHDFVEKVEDLGLDDIDPRNFSPPEAKIISWIFAYFVFKVAFKLIYGGSVWEETSLIHNAVSIFVGFYDVYHWDLPEESTCLGLNHRSSLAVALQGIHSITDFVVFLPEMLEQYIFVWHHLVIIFTSIVLPYCPGCYFVIIAYTLAEAGSISIAIDFQWRKHGLFSRGLKRTIIFGLTRVVNLYLLYRIYLVTPSRVNFTLSTDSEELFTVNFPICMITSVGGSVMMLIVNGVTWMRMYKSYVKFKKKRKLEKLKKKKA